MGPHHCGYSSTVQNNPPLPTALEPLMLLSLIYVGITTSLVDFFSDSSIAMNFSCFAMDCLSVSIWKFVRILPVILHPKHPHS
ncbi:hypothetical protein AMECASPLE_034819 [Ameca splendens]|uniref:Uncharacterized protein n=1 Tax=Ameca splendens TaxID=208324 RepID=A0ABV0XW70_9TELE